MNQQNAGAMTTTAAAGGTSSAALAMQRESLKQNQYPQNVPNFKRQNEPVVN